MLRHACRVFAFLPVLLTTGLAAGSEGERVVRVWDEQYFGANARAWSIVVAPDRTVRVGANSVLSFDGDHWASHAVPHSYAVRALALGPDGKLWVGAVGQVGYFDESRWEFHSLTAALPEGVSLGDVWRVFPDARGAVVFTQTAVLRWRSGHWRVWHFPGARRLPANRALGAIWFFHRPTGLWTFEESGPVLQIPTSQLSGADGLVYVTDLGGELLFISHSGLFRRRGTHLVPWSEAGSAFVRRGDPTSVCRLPGDRIAISTLTAGVALISGDGERVEIIDRDHGLPSRTVFQVVAGVDNTLWCAMPGHVVAVDLHNEVRICQPENVSFGSLDALETFAGRLYVTTDDGLLYRDRIGGFRPAVSGVRYRDLIATSNGLLATRPTGIDLLSEDRSTQVYRTNQDPICISATAERGHWLFADGFSMAELRESPGGQWAADRLATLPDIAISFAWENEDSIWASTAGGKLFHFQRNSGSPVVPVFVPGSAGPRSVQVAAMGGKVIALTAEGGFVHTPGGFKPIAGMPRLPVLAVSRPEAGQCVWVVLGSPFRIGDSSYLFGALRLSRGGTVTWTLSPIACPSTIGQVRRVHAGANGAVWIGGTKSLARIVPPLTTNTSGPNPPVIRTNVPDNGSVPFGAGPVRCELGSTEYLHRSGVRFESRLVGLEERWSEPTDDAVLTYPGLHEGRYELHVRTIDLFGRTSPEVATRFRILPPWYRTGWAQGAAVALTAGLVFTGMQLRHRRTARRARALETAVAAKTAELAKANAAKSDFIANMSHDLRHPLSGIVGLSIALDGSALSPVQRQWVHSIQNCGHLLSHLVDDVLDLALIEAGQMSFDSVPFVPAELALTCAEMMSASAAEAGCTIRTSDDPGSNRSYLGDPGRVQQIVINFLSNAFKAAPRTEVHLRVVMLFEDRLRFEVADCGTGITATDLERLFTKFTRLDARTKTPGIGLGLALCRQIAHGMGGEVGAVSTPGQGSTFFLELPVERASSAATVAPIATYNGRRALIVDDIEYAASATAAVCSRLGFATTTADSPAKAVEACAGQLFDLVLIDWDIALGATGADLLRVVRLEAGAHDAKAIAVSAHTDSTLRSACDAAGFDAFLLKPITPESLESVLRSKVGVPIASGPAAPSNVTTSPNIGRSLDTFLDDSLLSLRLTRTHQNLASLHRTAHAILGCARMVDAYELSLAAARLLRADLIDEDALQACETALLNLKRKRSSEPTR